MEHGWLIIKSALTLTGRISAKMTPPLFGDLGKEAKDLFEKNFYLDHVKFDLKGLLYGAMQYQSSQKCRIKDGKMSSEVEAGYEADGFTLRQKLNTDSSLLNCELKVNRPELMGVSIAVSGTFNPANAARSYSVGAKYLANDYNFELTTNSFNLLRATGVFNLLDFWTFGFSEVVDPNGFKTLNTNLITGFHNDRGHCFFNCDLFQKTVTGSMLYAVNQKIQMGTLYSLRRPDGHSNLGFCGSYTLNDFARFKTRINSDFKFGMSCIFQLKPGITVTICTEIDAQKPKQGDHKIGFGLEFS